MKTASILIAYTLLLVGILTSFALYTPKPVETGVSKKDFVGVHANGFKYSADGQVQMN